MIEDDINAFYLRRIVKRLPKISLSMVGIISSAILLVPAEIMADLGVATSNKCRPSVQVFTKLVYHLLLG